MFLGFAISIGSDFVSVLSSPDEKDDDKTAALDTITLGGTFIPNSSTVNNPMSEGSFTFTNTSAPTHQGDVVCIRDANNPFYLKSSK